MRKFTAALMSVVLPFSTVAPAFASSHREAPYITENPKVDGTDFYLFTSYEQGRSEYVTIIANYQPLEDAYGGPNYFTMDPQALYEIHIDNNADLQEDLTFQFRFTNEYRNIGLPIGPASKDVAIPIVNVGTAGPGVNDTANLNVIESYKLALIRGDRRSGRPQAVRNANTRADRFAKPSDYIGTKSFPAYEAYAKNHIFPISIPGCSSEGRVFVGQRKEGFVVNLGETFDLINIKTPVASTDADERSEPNTIADKNVTTLALELPKACISGGAQAIGAWTTSSLREKRELRSSPTVSNPTREFGDWIQVSRLGSPLVNELVIGLKDKDRFNASEPKDDARFLTYVTNPTLPALIEALFGVKAPTLAPRADLQQVFLTGVPTLNQTSSLKQGEMLRLNLKTPAVSADAQKPLGVIGGDVAGYPNGRRPGDDVVDISLRAVMGVLLPADVAPSKSLRFTDGAYVDATMFDSTFPYLKTPLPGSPNQAG